MYKFKYCASTDFCLTNRGQKHNADVYIFEGGIFDDEDNALNLRLLLNKQRPISHTTVR